MWPMGLLFLKTCPVKQYSYENDFSGVFESVLVIFVAMPVIIHGELTRF